MGTCATACGCLSAVFVRYRLRLLERVFVRYRLRLLERVKAALV